jgi:hypothetical protein
MLFKEPKQKEEFFWKFYPMFYSLADLETIYKKKQDRNENDQDFFNLLLERAFRDLLLHPKWKRWVRRKCQQKLRRLPLPKFVDRLKVRRVVLCSHFPLLSRESCYKDGDGQAMFSFELDATPRPEDGGCIFEMTLESKLNSSYFTTFQGIGEKSESDPDLAGMSDDEDDDEEVSFDTISSSSSEDEEDFEQLPLDVSTDTYKEEDRSPDQEHEPLPISKDTPRTLMDKLRAKGTVLLNKNKTVRKYFDDLVSSSHLTATVRVQSLKGTLLLSQPAWPSDRLWFRLASKPDLKLKVHLKHGNAGRPLIKSAWLRNLLEERLTKHLVSVLMTWDDVSLHPLLVLPNTQFYQANRSADGLKSAAANHQLFIDKLNFERT